MAVDIKAGAHAGEKLTLGFDGLGKAISRTHLGAVPEGGTNEDRPFIAKRSFAWDGQRLAAETGLNFQDQPIWRYQYAPGARWLDDAPQVRVERDLLGSPSSGTYELIRDEMGSVLAVGEAREGQGPQLLARYLQTPFGEVHVEMGPELVRIAFDPEATEAGGQQQQPVSGESVGGALRVVTTLPLDPASCTSGIVIEQWQEGSVWVGAESDDFAIAADATDATNILILRLAGWPKAARFRVTVTAALYDGFGRPLQLPDEEAGGVRVVLDVPADGQTPPQYARDFEQQSSEDELASTLGGRFPGGQTSTFHGMWTDPVSRLGYARARWYSARDASWLSEDPLGAVDSVNLYSYVAMQPTMAADPLGLVTSAQMHRYLRILQQASRNSKGYHGERVLERLLKSSGRLVLSGPIVSGKGVNEPLADIVTYNPATGRVELWDHKFLLARGTSTERNVSAASTFTDVVQQRANRDRAIALLEQSGLPEKKALIRAMLANDFDMFLAGVGTGNTVSGITERLRVAGVKFADREFVETGRPSKTGGKALRAVVLVGAAASVLSYTSEVSAGIEEDSDYQSWKAEACAFGATCSDNFLIRHSSALRALAAAGGEEIGGNVGGLIEGGSALVAFSGTGPGALFAAFFASIHGGMVGDETGRRLAAAGSESFFEWVERLTAPDGAGKR